MKEKNKGSYKHIEMKAGYDVENGDEDKHFIVGIKQDGQDILHEFDDYYDCQYYFQKEYRL